MRFNKFISAMRREEKRKKKKRDKCLYAGSILKVYERHVVNQGKTSNSMPYASVIVRDTLWL